MVDICTKHTGEEQVNTGEKERKCHMATFIFSASLLLYFPKKVYDKSLLSLNSI